MGAIEQQVVAAVATSSESFTLIVLILGALFTLIGGSYIYTWKGNAKVWEALNDLKTNDIKHLEERVTEIEKGL